jgi:hypothetical protein
MKYLLYYPQWHCFKEEQMHETKKTMERIKKGVTLSEKESELLDNFASFEYCNDYWQAFLEYLEEQEPFNHLYLEGYAKSIRATYPNGSIAKKCIDYVVESGAKIELTEGNFWYSVFSIIHQDPYLKKCIPSWLDNYAKTTGREKAVVKNIRSTLKDGERGLLFFGAWHKEALIKRFSRTDIEFKVVGQH